MTTLNDRPNTALLVIDVQHGVVAGAHDVEAVVGNVATLIDRARHAGAPVIWVQHHDDELERGSDAWHWLPEVAPGPDDPIVHKSYGDAFEATVLEADLAGHRVGHVVVAGAQSDACIRSTLHGAFVRGYDVTLVTDAHTTEDLTEWGAPPPELVISHTNLYWGFQAGPGRTAATVATADVDFSA